MTAAEQALAKAVRVAEQVLALSTAVDVAAAAVLAAGERIDDARRDVLTERAAGYRLRAEAATAVADRRQAVTDNLVAKLAEHEGIAFIAPPMPTYGENMSWQPTITARLRAVAAGLLKTAAQCDEDATQATPEQLPHRVRRPVEPLTPWEETYVSERPQLAAAA